MPVITVCLFVCLMVVGFIDCRFGGVLVFGFMIVVGIVCCLLVVCWL